MRLATESIRLVSGTAEFCPARSRVQSPPEAPATKSPSALALWSYSQFGPNRSLPNQNRPKLHFTGRNGNSIKIKHLSDCYGVGFDDQTRSIDTAFDPSLNRRICCSSSRPCSFLGTGDRYTCHQSDVSHVNQHCYRLRECDKCTLHSQECDHNVHHQQLEIKHYSGRNLQCYHDDCDRPNTSPCFRRCCVLFHRRV